MVAVTKLSVSLDAELAEVVRAAAAEEGESVSAWIAAAAGARLRNRLLGVAVDQALAEMPDLDASQLDVALEAARARAIHTAGGS